MVQSNIVAKAIFWAMFVVIILAGLNAFFVFPVQVGYGFVAALIFRLLMVFALGFIVVKFFRDIRVFNRCC